MFIDASLRTIERRAKRIKVFQPAMLVVDNASRRFHLLDVSVMGLRGHAQDDIPKGARVQVECLSVVCSAVVQWRIGRKFGLLLDRPLSQDQMDVLTGTVRQPLRHCHPPLTISGRLPREISRDQETGLLVHRADGWIDDPTATATIGRRSEANNLRPRMNAT